MKTRKWMTQLHLILGSFFLPLMLLMPLTGSLYIWGQEGEQDKVEAFKIQGEPPEEKTAMEAFFRQEFKKQNLDFDFEYIRAFRNDYTFRPVTRVHYMATKDNGTLTFYKLTPNLLKRLIELHKGHGPVLMRWLESAFGIALILVTLSGIWLVFTVPSYRKSALISFSVGLALIILCLI